MHFNTLEELKTRVMPALKIKEEYYMRKNKDYTVDDIWFYLTLKKWKKSKNLTLNEIVNDILKLEDDDLTIDK